jgi:RsiW-degrading membrane proteinase PrsW (M82 family)
MVWIIDLAVISIISVLPPLAYLLWLRRADRYEPDDLNDLFKALLAGATIGVFGGAVLTLLLLLPFSLFYMSESSSTLLIAILLAPIAEELVKAICVMLFKRKLNRLESGIIYGAAIGFGFAIVENVLYGFTSTTEGLLMAVFLVCVRSLTAAFAHGSFTAVTGYGIARWVREGTNERTWLKYYALAVVLHGFFNAVASLSEMMEMSLFLDVASMVVLAATVIATFVLLRRRVKQLDEGVKSDRSRIGAEQMN